MIKVSNEFGLCLISPMYGSNSVYVLHGLAVNKDNQRKGHGTRLVQAVLKRLETEKPALIVASVAAENIACRQVMSKCGFKPLVDAPCPRHEHRVLLYGWTNENKTEVS